MPLSLTRHFAIIASACSLSCGVLGSDDECDKRWHVDSTHNGSARIQGGALELVTSPDGTDGSTVEVRQSAITGNFQAALLFESTQLESSSSVFDVELLREDSTHSILSASIRGDRTVMGWSSGDAQETTEPHTEVVAPSGMIQLQREGTKVTLTVVSDKNNYLAKMTKELGDVPVTLKLSASSPSSGVTVRILQLMVGDGTNLKPEQFDCDTLQMN